MSERRLRSAVLLDAHPLWLEAIEPVVARVGGEVIAKATDPEVALALIEERQPDLLVIDITQLNGDGARYIERALERAPHLKAIVLSAETARERVQAAFSAGAAAYVFKTVEPEDLASAIRQAFDHSVYLSNGDILAPSPSPRPTELLEALTAREREILRLVADGRSNAKIARDLSITIQTVKAHLSNTYRKIGVSNRTEAARWAQLNGLVVLERKSG